ncbi:hypothetical protein HPB49_003927 [Dermacentor silvarum]|uniref:Uncharacterized protein n=1 Tax=Dermacentor silvarum TaxID=543639 RepID=A0ACB8DUA7_DERSI|nr:hypothetical protein HPB49_003927 [Dermacentor silvarum]
MFKLQRVPVHPVVKQFQETGGVKDRHRSGRPRTARTREVKWAVGKKIKRNSLRSIIKLTREHGVSNSTMQLLVKEDLKFTVRKPAKGQLLKDQMKASTLEKCIRMKQRALSRDETLNRILFTDEKIFSLELSWNSRNNRKLLPMVLRKLSE